MKNSRPFLALLLIVSCSGAALGHEGGGVAGGFLGGFAHPLLGWDHVLAMVAVGLWGALLGRPGIRLLPVVFPLVMVLGGVLAGLGLSLPAVETGIATSAVVLGAMIAIVLRPPVVVAGVIVGAFALFHGHAHGTELPGAVNPVAYGAGFVTATALLHALGIGLGMLGRWPAGRLAVRLTGGAVAALGVGFLASAV